MLGRRHCLDRWGRSPRFTLCADPVNFGRWNLLPDGVMKALGGDEYLVDLPQRRRVMRLMPHNDFGVLDY